jgi:hypothetical protein
LNDSALQNLQQLPSKNIGAANTNADQYNNLLNNKITAQDSTIKIPQQAAGKYVTNANNNVTKYNGAINKKTTQGDSVAKSLQQIPQKYIQGLDSKMDKYTSRVNTKTEKTLKKLSHLENKIQPILQQADPQAEQRLFGNGQMTFTTLLQQYESGQAISTQCHSQYNAYNDKVTTQLNYLQQQQSKLDSNLVKPVADANAKAAQLNKEDDQNAAIQDFIKQRRKQLMDGAIQYLAASPYLTQINQESFYYVQTIKNYKQILSDPQQGEKTAMDIMDKMPAYQKFMGQNSQLASLFGLSSGGAADTTSNTDSSKSMSGLQTRAAVQNLMQQKIPSSSSGTVQQSISQNIQQAPMQLSQIKSMLGVPSGGSSTTTDVPSFTPNMQKTKTLLQRLVYGVNTQFTKSSVLLPATADIAFTVGYKLNDKGLIGVGASYNIGMGTIQAMSITQQGLGLRSFIDWKIKKTYYATGGYEMDYNTQFESIYQLKNNISAWQKLGLIGLTKKISIQSAVFKTTDVQILYNILYRQNVPITQPFLFRVGYSF